MTQEEYKHIDDLVEQTRNGNSEAFEMLLDYYAPIIKSTVGTVANKYVSMLREDLFSECVLILHELCMKYDKDKSYFSYYLSNRLKPYLVSKVKSKYIDKIPTVSLSVCDKLEIGEVINLSVGDHAHLQMEIEKLPDNLRQAIFLFYFEDLTQKECADAIGISQPAFNKRLKKALGILKNTL